jgi:hypothetical protein
MGPAVAFYVIRINGHFSITVLSAFPALTSRRRRSASASTSLRSAAQTSMRITGTGKVT